MIFFQRHNIAAVMPCLPVVERELRVAARRRATYRIRFAAVLLMLGVLAWNVAHFPTRNFIPTQHGQAVFGALAFFAFLYAALIGVFATSDCVSEEKREGTLGLLFLTDLKGHDVIYGKLAGHSVNAFYGLIAILPILGIPILLGGVTLPQFAKAALALISTIVLSLATGVFVSTYSRNERKAIFYTVLLLFAIVCVPFGLMIWFSEFQRMISPKQIWLGLMFSPGYALGIAASGPETGWPTVSYWYSIGWTWLFAALLLARASAKVPKSWNESDLTIRTPRLIPKALVLIQRGTAPRRLLDLNPFLWLSLRGETNPKVVLGFAVTMVVIGLAGIARFGRFMLDPDVFFPLMIFAHSFLKLWILSEASRRFGEDRRGSGFELLLSTPLNEKEIIRGQWQALLRQFGPAIAILLACELLAAFSNMRFADRTRHLGTMFFLGADFVALSWAGMWLGLTSKSRGRALFFGLLQVMIIPFFVARVFSGIFSYVFDSSPTWDETSGTFGGFCAYLFADCLITLKARHHLRRNFRRLATERYGRADD